MDFPRSISLENKSLWNAYTKKHCPSWHHSHLWTKLAILYVWKTRKKSQLTKKAKPWWSLSLCVYIYANMWIYHYLKHKIILLWLEIYFLCILYLPFIFYLTPQTILDIETWSKSSIRAAIIFVFLLIILVLETR